KVTVKYQVGVGKVVYHKHAESSGQLDHFLEELYLHALSRRVIREGDCDQLGAMGLDDGRQFVQQITRVCCGDLHKLSAGDNDRVRMNRISGLRHKRRFSRGEQGHYKMRETVFSPDRHHRFGLWIETDAPFSRVTAAYR